MDDNFAEILSKLDDGYEYFSKVMGLTGMQWPEIDIYVKEQIELSNKLYQHLERSFKHECCEEGDS